jgi:hypothetical protein
MTSTMAFSRTAASRGASGKTTRQLLYTASTLPEAPVANRCLTPHTGEDACKSAIHRLLTRPTSGYAEAIGGSGAELTAAAQR